jgi:sucrose-phosphate synthase
MGNRDDINDLAPGSQEVIREILTTIDRYDLYGQVAIPKHHKQDDIPHIYRYASTTRGVFVNAALQEPFGLTLIEACAYGVPIVATKHGGPVEIHRTLKCAAASICNPFPAHADREECSFFARTFQRRSGFLIEPTDTKEIENSLVTLLTDSNIWEQKLQNGLNNVHKYSWSAHCQRHLIALAEAERWRKGVQEQEMEGISTMSKTESLVHLQELADEEIDGGFKRISKIAHIPARERVSNQYASVVAIAIDTTSPMVRTFTLVGCMLDDAT